MKIEHDAYTIDVNKFETNLSVSLFHHDFNCLSIAEVSLIDNQDGKNVYYFNRLNVPNKMNGKGFGSILLDLLLKEFYPNSILLNDLNPYGAMDFDTLKQFYIRHGFREVSTSTLVYES